MINYTKGEWKVSCRKNVYGDECYAINSGDEMIAIISGFGHKANAQLIASAPLLYEALKAIIKHYDIILIGDDKECDVLAFEALEKAEGQ